jgi:exopolyphosphatase / guanosine-5'-triphosphate,3'-diphosphate pyrophosphatase
MHCYGQPMPPIVPRWEWRTFGSSFGAADPVVAGLTPTGVEESDELYLLSEDGENVKVRAELLDIKLLREVDRRGLQRWEPTLKASFPLDAAAVAAAFEALHQPLPTLSRTAYSLDEFLDELVEPSGTIRVVSVHKRRVRYTIDECTGELSDIEIGGRHTRTLAVEAENPAAVMAAVTALGLGDRVNTSVPLGLTSLIDDAPPRYAVIDVGTNSVKFHVAEQTSGGAWRAVVDRAEITRLGDGLADSGAISTAALERTTVAIAGMVDEATKHHARAIFSVGTAGLRTASNRDQVVAEIEEATGVTVDTISGEEESRLAYLAVRTDLMSGDGALVVFDTGGGSSQFTFGHGVEVDERFSVDVGAVRFTERFGLAAAVSTDALRAALDAIASDLHRLDGRPAPDALVGMGGAVTNITAVKLGLDPYDPDAVQGAILERADVDRQIELYRSRDADSRRTIVGLQPKRADVILAGACIVRTVMEKLGQDTMTVSDRGLRHGLLIDRFGPSAHP